MEIAPGLHRIGNDNIAAYLLVDETGITLIDAGLPGLRRALRRELTAIGRTEADIRGVILTHADFDHIGFAEAIRSDHGVPVYVGPGEGEYARRERGAQPNEKSAWRLGPTLSFIATCLPLMGRVRAVSEVTEVGDGAKLSLPGAPEIVALPGHTVGHIGVWSPRHRALFVGDALTTRHVMLGGTEPRDAPFSEQPAIAQASLERLREIDSLWVLPGHGPAWQGTAASLIDAVARSRA